MDFFIQDNIIGIAFSGITGLIFLLYFIIESLFFYSTKTLMIQNFIAYKVFKKRFRKLLPTWWSIESVQVYSNGFLKYRVWVDIKLKTKSEYTTSGWIKMDRLLKIDNIDNLRYQMEFYDKELSTDNKISYNRDKLLEDLGI
jgi:hypothetical protein